MANPMSWRSKLEAMLGAERLVDLVDGAFVDKPKSMRVGLLGVTDSRVVFYRKKVFGEEFIAVELAEIVSAEAVVDEFSAMLNQGGADAMSVVVSRANGDSFTMKSLTSAEAARVAASISGRLPSADGTTG